MWVFLKGTNLGLELLGHRAGTVCHQIIPHCFPPWFSPIYTPACCVKKKKNLVHIPRESLMSDFYIFCQSGGWEMVSHCGFVYLSLLMLSFFAYRPMEFSFLREACLRAANCISLNLRLMTDLGQLGRLRRVQERGRCWP